MSRMNAFGEELSRLSSKKRVLEAIALREPDIVPIFITITPELAEKVAAKLGVKSYTLADSPLSQNRISFHEILVELGNDVVGIGACSPDADPMQDLGGGYSIDEWKIKYKKVGYYTEQVEYPLSSAETVGDIQNFPFPEPSERGRFGLAKRVSEEYGEQYAICGDLECTIFEAAWHLTGLEKFLLDLVMEKDYVFALMDRIQEYSLGVGKELISLGADIIWLGDDMGTQRGMLVSPEMWRKYFKERMRGVVQALKAHHHAVKIAYHCCGSYFPIIPDLIEIGIDILNALQPTAKDMDLTRLKAMFGKRAALFGGMDVQSVLPFGSLEDAEKEVRRVLAAAGKGGGLIIAGAHNLQPDVSVEKLIRVFQVAKREGKYPTCTDGKTCVC